MLKITIIGILCKNFPFHGALAGGGLRPVATDGMLQKFPNIELRLDTTCCPSYYPSRLQNTVRQNTPEVKVIRPDLTLNCDRW